MQSYFEIIIALLQTFFFHPIMTLAGNGQQDLRSSFSHSWLIFKSDLIYCIGLGLSGNIRRFHRANPADRSGRSAPLFLVAGVNSQVEEQGKYLSC
jgi:hypothetical protein